VLSEQENEEGVQHRRFPHRGWEALIPQPLPPLMGEGVSWFSCNIGHNGPMLQSEEKELLFKPADEVHHHDYWDEDRQPEK
jgi:hypothetical protein